MYVPYDLSKVKVLDLSQNFSMDSPPFAFYEGPTIKWVKKIAFEGGIVLALYFIADTSTLIPGPPPPLGSGGRIAQRGGGV